ncbi:adhesion G protein-coupled receptor F5-like, partial [Heterodontus francisci]|uniref:adhesion G protein-coupled receptor F5-like n=1 Tax=Heterodontus francisci TaxID=7792 RepID=UPI00355ACF59
MKTCSTHGIYGAEEDFCVSAEINNILQYIENSTELAKNLPGLIRQLANISNHERAITPGNLLATVDILKTFASITNVSINQSDMKDFLGTVNGLISGHSESVWKTVKNKKNDNTSSELLKSVEVFTRLLSPTEESFKIIQPNIQLKGMKVDSTSGKPYIVNFSDLMVRNKLLNGTVIIIESELAKLSKNSLAISIAYGTMIDILFQSSNTSSSRLNGLIMTTTTENSSTCIEMTFIPLNTTFDPASVQCVFWNFALNGTGGWDQTGCRPETNGSNIVCKCNHLTSFSTLLLYQIPKESPFLSHISHITTGISLGCLAISVIIEGVVWKHVTKNKISQARHIIMLNIVLSLLTADTLFIASEYVMPNTAVCIPTVFLMNFLFLALFFWMFTLALLLLYHLIFLFKDFSRAAMMTISFTLGYLCPSIISISTFTVAYLRNQYIKKDKCWLNTEEIYLYLSFIVPILTIVTINMFIAFVAMCKMLRPTIGEKLSSHAKDKNVPKQIARSIAILTSLLGLTWLLAFAFLDKHPSVAIHYAINILNGLQGFFILVFGIIMDSKVSYNHQFVQ